MVSILVGEVARVTSEVTRMVETGCGTIMAIDQATSGGRQGSKQG